MGIQERKEREKEEIRNRIIEAAEHLFLEKGYAQVSMRNIAQEIEYSTTVIYNLFPNKQAILLRLFVDKYSILLQKFEQIRSARGVSPLETLERLMWAYLEFGWEYPDYYQLAVIRNVVSEDRQLEYMDEDAVSIRIYEAFVDTVRDCLNAEGKDGSRAELIAQTLWACLHGALSLRIVHPQFPWEERSSFFRSTVDTAIRGALGMEPLGEQRS
ncbi:TetR/AcrR family transcriptional regulator [Paenibacillus caui]|uniref:TetR/AcrR family transcriptional regulator n=1 Tax=Paenibacillus caui TaxID=2873927 RepID=UPI001CA93E8A|nr:TetR/AcrR family transcriptional regulator [Paenibacillus caui]